MGFIIFGTTAQFRKVYAQNVRKICCCGGRKTKNSTEDVERVQIGRGGNGFSGRLSGRFPTYHCRVESNGMKLEMGESGRIVPAEDKNLVIARAQEVLQQRSTAKLEQPWRTLGIDRQVER